MEDWASHHVKLWIAEITTRPEDSIQEHELLTSLWIDSLNAVEFIMHTEDELKIDLSNFSHIRTVGELIQFVRDSKRN